MKDEAAVRAAELIRRERVAALGTMHGDAPAVSMVPYSLLQLPFTFVVLVSALAAHTRDMLSDSRVSLLVMEADRDDRNPHALSRVSIRGEARPIAVDDVHYVAARTAYEMRFPRMRDLFDLADFGLFGIRALTVRVVTGFAQAHSITADALAAALAPTGVARHDEA